MIIAQLAALSVNRSSPEELEKNPLSEDEKKAFMTSIASANPDSEVEFWEGFLDLE